MDKILYDGKMHVYLNHHVIRHYRYAFPKCVTFEHSWTVFFLCVLFVPLMYPLPFLVNKDAIVTVYNGIFHVLRLRRILLIATEQLNESIVYFVCLSLSVCSCLHVFI